jgi:hypothetical protein
MRRSTKWTPVALIGAICATLLPFLLPGWTAAHAILADAPENQSWHAPASSSEAVFIGDKGTPTLVIKKSVVQGQSCSMSIQADGKWCIVHCGEIQLPLDLSKDAPAAANKPSEKTATLKLDGTSQQPGVFINGKEIASARGKWMQILSSPTTTIALELTGSSFANVKFSAGGAGATAAAAPAATAATKPAALQPAATTAEPAANANKTGDSAPSSSHGVPADLPLLNIPANLKPTQMVQAAISLRSNGLRICPTCNGKGQVTSRVQTGSNYGNGFVQSTYRETVDKCPTCNGTGRFHAGLEALDRLMDKLTTSMAGADPREKDYSDRLAAVAKILSENLAVDPDAQQMLTSEALTAFPLPATRTGRTFVIAGHLEFSEPLANDPQGHVYGIRATSGSNNRLVLLVNPRIAEVTDGGQVVAGGIFAGRAGSDQMPVVQEGFILRANTSH